MEICPAGRQLVAEAAGRARKGNRRARRGDWRIFKKNWIRSPARTTKSQKPKRVVDVLKKALDDRQKALVKASEWAKKQAADKDVKAENYGYQEITLARRQEAFRPRRADPLAAVEPHRRRADGRAWQPPA